MGLQETSNGTITGVKSDHVDAATLPIARGDGAGTTAIFHLDGGYANADPLTVPGAHLINPHTAMTIPAYYSALRFIAETIAALPKHVYLRTPTGPVRQGNHPAEWTMNSNPSDLNTPFTFWSTFFVHAINWSDGFAAYNATGPDPEVFNLSPDRVSPFRFNGVQFYAYDLQKPQNSDPNSRYLIFAANEMIHLPALSFDGMSGLPMVHLMAQALRTTKATEKYVDSYFGQGGIIRGTISSDQQLTQEQVIQYTNLLQNKFSGVDNAHKWMVLGSGLKATTLTPELDTAQTEENRKFSVQEVCRMLRVPPHIVYELTKATWANIESLGIEVVKYTLNNWIVPCEQELTRKLLTKPERKSGMYIQFDVAALLRGDHAAQIDGSVKRVSNGLTTPDEERAIMGMPPYPNGEGAAPRVPANTTPLAPPAEEEPDKTDDDEDESSDEELSAKIDPLIMDVAERAASRLEKANPKTIPECNVFCDRQADFIDAALKPIFEAFNLDNIEVGAEYAKQLRKHFAAMNRGEQSTPPDLAVIFNGAINGN